MSSTAKPANRVLAQNPPERAWMPHQSAFILANDPAPVLLDGGFGKGGTDALCMWAYLQCELYPNNLVLLGREHYTDLADSTMRSFFSLPYVYKNASTWNEGRATYKHHNGSEILFRHLDEDAGLKNLNLGGVGIDQAEETAPDRFDLLLGRLRRPNSSRQYRLTSNPNGHDWLWQIFYGPGCILWRSEYVEEFYTASPDYRDGYKVVRCSTLDNPHLPPDYVARLLKDYPQEFIDQYVKGSREIMPGYRFFDAMALAQQVPYDPIEIHGKPGTGYFVDSYPKPEWRPQEGGPVRIYERYDERDLYVIGSDIATGEGLSWCASVLRNCRFNRVAAVIDADMRPDEQAVQAWLLSRSYGNAVIAPERNGVGVAMLTALRPLTGHLFAHTDGKDGWLTDARSRAELYAQLQREIAGRSIELKDRQLIEQCQAVTMSKRGRPDASPGFRNDLVMALGISGLVRQLRGMATATSVQDTSSAVHAQQLSREQIGLVAGIGRARTRVAGR